MEPLFCSKGGDVELWSEIIMGSSNDRIFKKNLMGRGQDIGGAKITNLAFGGSRMFLTRKDLQCVEVETILQLVGFAAIIQFKTRKQD
ncbi:unnamed protein product [Lathyrus sativus]|nr:unnamed protein product [Lathyrus sativus]